MMKIFVIWKVLSRFVENREDYIGKIMKSFRVADLILNCKKKIMLNSVFSCLKSIRSYGKLKRTGVICLINSLKRSIRISKRRTLAFAFNLLLIINRELHIKHKAVSFILKNIRKDIGFRLKICFTHWKDLTEYIKDRRLKGLAFYQTFAGILKSQEKLAFTALNHFETSFMKTKKNKNNQSFNVNNILYY